MKQLAGIDVQALYPPHPVTPPEASEWTYDAFIKAGEKCKKAGFGYGLGIGNTGNSVGNAATWFAAFGAEIVDIKGNIVVNSDKMRHFLEWAQQLVRILPDDALSYDDATDNRVMIAGKSALIYDPPSPYAVAMRDNPKPGGRHVELPLPGRPGRSFRAIWPRVFRHLVVQPEQDGGEGTQHLPCRA